MGGLGIAICGALSAVFLSLGIASVVIYATNPGSTCGVNGPLTVHNWILGTGIGYTIIGAALLVSLILAAAFDFVIGLIVSLFMAVFAVPWTIVGASVWLRYGLDCAMLNVPIWCLMIADVLTMITVVPITIGLIPVAISEW
jgi:hypothetical protein